MSKFKNLGKIKEINKIKNCKKLNFLTFEITLFFIQLKQVFTKALIF